MLKKVLRKNFASKPRGRVGKLREISPSEADFLSLPTNQPKKEVPKKSFPKEIQPIEIVIASEKRTIDYHSTDCFCGD